MNLTDAFRFHRAQPMRANTYTGFNPTGRHAAEALARARADMLAYRNAAAHYEDMAAYRDAARVALQSGEAPNLAPAALADAEERLRAAQKAMSKARRYRPDMQPNGRPWPYFGAAMTEDNPRRGRVIRCALSADVPGFRFVGNVEPDGRRGAWAKGDDSGWYADPFGEGWNLCRGVVYQLPGRDGKARFVAGYAFTEESGGPALDLGHVFTEDMRGAWGCDQDPRNTDAARDAAAHADALAKEAAESEREYQTAFHAGQAWADLKTEEEAARTEARAILKERRAAMNNAAVSDSGFFALCDVIRGRVRALVESIAESRAKRRELAEGDDSRLMFWNGEERLRAAFCDGAGLDQFPA